MGLLNLRGPTSQRGTIMIVHVDDFLHIGQTHNVCEDYILSDVDPFPYIVLSDGCSSSRDSDFGSRILTHVTKRLLTDSHVPLHVLSQHAICEAGVVSRMLKLHETSLDATLMFLLIILFNLEDNPRKHLGNRNIHKYFMEL